MNYLLNSRNRGCMAQNFVRIRLPLWIFAHLLRKRPPEEEPSIAVALRIDESASMSAFGRLEAAALLLPCMNFAQDAVFQSWSTGIQVLKR